MKHTDEEIKRPRVFKDPKVLNEMLYLRRQGATYEELAFRYGVDKSSIYHWCERYKLGRNVLKLVLKYYNGKRIQLKRSPRILVIDFSQQTEAVQQSYKDYLAGSVNPTRKRVFAGYTYYK